MADKASSETKNVLQLTCKNCGAAVGFDIPTQSYRCVHCGSITDTKDAQAAWILPDQSPEGGISIHGETMSCPSCGGEMNLDKDAAVYRCSSCGGEQPVSEEQELPWKELQKKSWEAVQREEEVAVCSSCGAKVLFKKDEASEQCEFCGGNLVNHTLQEEEELPQLIIPFVLTEEEAQERLKEWLKGAPDNRDTRRVKQNLKNLKGYYLPYRMIRGPLKGTAYRDMLSRKYDYKGFLEHAFVNASRQLDNEVLDAAEPFDLSGLRPFEPGYVGGHRVKLGDVPPSEIISRTKTESVEGYRPYVAKVLQNSDVEVRVDTVDFLHLPVLLPFYVQKVGSYIAVVNGQTGKVAVQSSQKSKESKRWLIEPTLLTAAAALAAGFAFHFVIPYVLGAAFMAGLVFYTAFGQDRNRVFHRKIYKGKESRASRQDGKLKLSQEQNILKNPLSNAPAFYVNDGTREVHVEMRFYTPGRIFWMLMKMFVITFLPAILAVLFHGGFEGLAFQYGAAWYITAGGIDIIYWIRGVRWDVYNHPVLYEVMPDGTRKLFGDRKSRRLSILGVFGLEHVKDLVVLGSVGALGIGFMAFLLLGSTLAIIY